MFKKTVTYTDYDGVERTEDVYFNLSKPEIIEMQLNTPGGYAELIERIINAKDTRALVSLYKELLLKSYGIKSDDGKRFIKSEEISTAFSQTPAYDTIYMELATDADAASAFVNGLLPTDLMRSVNDSVSKNSALGIVE